MNKTRIIGALVLIIGIIVNLKLNHWIAAFLSGVMVVAGGYSLITGKSFFNKYIKK